MIEADLLFKAMADSTRRRLLGVLSRQDLTVSELVEVLDQPQSTVSRHLKVLTEAGLLLDRRRGAAVMYAARPPARLNGDRTAATAAGARNGANGLGEAGILRDRLLEWAGREPLDDALDDRLRRIVHRRHASGGGFFETIGARWDQLRIDAFGGAFHLEAFTALLPHRWTVADIGTGTGFLLPLLARRFRRVIAVEPAGAMLEAARSRPELGSAGNVEFRPGSLAELPLKDGEMDLAIASLVLHHVARPVEALAELWRCVRPGGRLLIIEQHTHRNAAFHERMGDHWWGFSPARLARAVRDAGFSGVRSEPLTTARPTSRDLADSPKLFVLTAEARLTRADAPGVTSPTSENGNNGSKQTFAKE